MNTKNLFFGALLLVLVIASIYLLLNSSTHIPKPKAPQSYETPSKPSKIETVRLKTSEKAVAQEETPEERHQRLMEIIYKSLSKLSVLPPDGQPSDEEREQLLREIFAESGLLPSDLTSICGELQAFLLQIPDEEGKWSWNREAMEMAYGIQLFLEVLHENTNPAFEQWIGSELRGKLVSQVLQDFDLLHETARSYLAKVISAGMLTSEHQDILQQLALLQPVPSSVDLLLESFGKTDVGYQFLIALANEYGTTLESSAVLGVAVAAVLKDTDPSLAEEVAAGFLDQSNLNQRVAIIRNLGSMPSPDTVVALALLTGRRAQSGNVMSRYLSDEYREPLQDMVDQDRFGIELMRKQFLEVLRSSNSQPVQRTLIAVMRNEHIDLLEWLLGISTIPDWGSAPSVSNETKALSIQRLASLLVANQIRRSHVQEVQTHLRSKDTVIFSLACTAGLTMIRKFENIQSPEHIMAMSQSFKSYYRNSSNSQSNRDMLAAQVAKWLTPNQRARILDGTN